MGGDAAGVIQADIHQEQDPDYLLDVENEEVVGQEDDEEEDDDDEDDEDEEVDEEDPEFQELLNVAKVRQVQAGNRVPQAGNRDASG